MRAVDRREEIKRAQGETFESAWREGDPWDLETSALDQESYARQLALLGDRRYERALEMGCAAGAFTRRLAPLADRILAVDVAPSAIERARQEALANVEFRVGDVMELDPVLEGPWDLVIMSETVYYLGWLYTFFEIGWLARQLLEATRPGGRFLMANTVESDSHSSLMQPWLIDTYRDLFANVGYTLEAQEKFRSEKGGAEFETGIWLFEKPSS
ncbi:MAG: SAM-dependent methyltransferase [Actinomycetota bacterium]